MTQDPADMLEKVQAALAPDYTIVLIEGAEAAVFLAVAVPMRPGVTGVRPRLPSGRGLTRAQAMLSAGAEALEMRASLAQSWPERLAAMPRQDGRAMVQAHDMASGQVTWLPAQEVFLDHAAVTGEDLTCDARSTGCAAAPDTDEAAWRGLLECIEREAKAFWWHGGVAAHALPNSLIDAIAPRLLWWLERRERRFRLLGLVNDWGVPVVVAASSTPEGGQVAVGTAARFDVAEAALAAVTEMVQTEDALTRALQAGQEEAVAWAATGSMLTQPQFDPPWDGVPAGWTTTTEAALLARLIAVGLTAWWVEMTLPDDPLPSVRVVVPGLADMAGRLDCPRLRQAMDLPPNAPLNLQEPTPF